jgi:hypothetical protein
MKRSLYLFLLVPFLAFYACEPTDETADENADKVDSNMRILATDMYPNCWFNEQTLQNEVVHSKPWASKVDSTWSDSYGFRTALKDLGKEIPKSFTVNFWGLFPTPNSDTKLVIGIDSLTTQVFWAGIDLKDSVKEANVWREFTITLATPPNLRPDDRLTIYIWSFDKKILYVDDLKVSFTY